MAVAPFGLVVFLLAFASHWSGYAIPPEAPQPQISVADINKNNPRHACGEEWAGETSMDTGNIILEKGWKPSGADNICTLAHELTHYLQVQNHLHPNDVEAPAYYVEEMCFMQIFHHPEASATVQWARDMRKKHANNACTAQ